MLLASGSALASGFAVEHQNARAIGSAYAGAQARSGDAGFIFYNPAAIAGIDRAELSSNSAFFWGPARYENASATLVGGVPAAGLAADDGVLPAAFISSFAFAAPLSDRLTVGISVASPFGLRSGFAPDSAVRYYAQNASLLTVAISPTAAYELTPGLSIGASLKLQYMDLTASTVVDAGGLAFLNSIPGYTPGSSDLFAEFKGEDFAVGFTAGLQAQLAAGVRLGFSYASKVAHEFDGEATFDVAGSPAAQILNAASGIFDPSGFSSALTLPASYAVGLSIDASERLRLLASVGLARWSSFDQTVFVFDNPAQPPEIVTSAWSDAWSISVGGEFDLSDETTVRAGFMFDETPVNDSYAAPRIPDADRRWLTVGLTRRLNDRIEVDVGAAIVFNSARPIRLDGANPENLLRGALDADFMTDTYGVTGRMRYRF